MREVFGEILKKNFLQFLSYCPFLYFRHCKCNISESIIVRGLELLTADRVQ